MNKILKVYHVDNDVEYSNWIPGAVPVNNINDADLVLFEGGEDVNPMVYGEPIGSYTSFNTARDTKEIKVFEEAVKLKKHILGICRGSQLTCVLSGGKLVQHQANPSYIHYIYVVDGQKLTLIHITSTHHQAQYPYLMKKDEYKVLGYTVDLCKYHLDGNDQEIEPLPEEVEICYYPKTKVLGIQGHPESIWNERASYKNTFDYLHKLLDNFLNDKL